MKALTLITFLFFHAGMAKAEMFVSCNDGDTCQFSKKGEIIKIRLSGVDAPESDQPFGQDARDYLVSMLSGKESTLKCNGTSYDRITCLVFIGDHDIQKELVRKGWALDSPKYSQGKYKKDQEYAEKNKLGIWKKPDNYSPYCWRWLGTPECNKNKLYQQ